MTDSTPHADPAAADEAQALKTILVVDDDALSRAQLRAMLWRDGYTVLEAKNGQEAVDIFFSESPEMVLMDVRMPILDGYEATRVIKERSRDHFAPVIFLTANSSEEDLVRCLDNGGDDFLSKPCSRTVLKAKLGALDRLRRSHAALKEKNEQLATHHDRTLQEQEVAQKVFQNVVHPGCLDSPHIKYLISPTAIFNGDLLVAARTPAGSLHVLVGDFTGHGLSASIGALPVSEIFYGMTRNGFSISDIVLETNHKLKKVLPLGIFFAATLLEIQPAARLVAVWNGGNPDVLICNAEGIRQRVSSSNLPLGILDNEHPKMNVSPEYAELLKGDRILAYTDGVIETFNSERQMFGQKRLESAISDCANPDTRFDAILAGLAEFRGGAAQNDDTTLIEIDYDGTRAIGESDADTDNRVSKPPTGWSVSLEFDAACLRTTDPLPLILHVLMEIQGLYRHRVRLYTILAELFSNALEHGLLKLDSELKNTPDGFTTFYKLREKSLGTLENGWIRLGVEHVPGESGGQLTIVVEDSGEGFPRERLRVLQDTSQARKNGRGLRIVEGLCEEVSFNDKGNRVAAVYCW